MVSIEDWHHAVRELRDELYRTGDIQTTVAPLHYCYQHNVARFEGKTGWGHLNAPSPPCMEYLSTAPENTAQPPEPEPAPEQQEEEKLPW